MPTRKTTTNLDTSEWVMYRTDKTRWVQQYWTGTEWSDDPKQAKLYMGIGSVPIMGDPARPVGADVGRAAFVLTNLKR
jgi:hypothetical protein